MAGTHVLEVVKRDLKKKAVALRSENFIPGEVYGPGFENVHVAFSVRDFEILLNKISETSVIELKLDDGKTIKVFLKTLQRHKLTDKPIHVDFYVPAKGHKMTIHLPVKFVGTPVGLTQGGMFEIVHHEIPVEILPKDIVESIEFDVSELALNEHLTVEKILSKLPESAKVLLDEDESLAMVLPKVKDVSAEEESEEETAE